jgi:hypothetical protein
MKVKYKVIEYLPESEWIAVEFTRSDMPNDRWVRQFEFPDFHKEKLLDQIRAVASRVAGSWTRIPNHPEQLTIPETGTLDIEPELYLPYEPNPQYEEEPEIDPWTQDLLPGDITSPTQETVPWVVYDLTPEEVEQRLSDAANGAREERNFYLLQSDHIFCPDVEVANKEEWLVYRQALRDLPSQPEFPKELTWPERPKS